jgi:KipI family sensor histidine kinase inhibitor
MRVLPIGSSAVLVEDPPADPARWSLAFRDLHLPGVIDVVPAARTVLIRCASSSTLAAAKSQIGEITPTEIEHGPDRPTVVIPVRYCGPDLETVAEQVGRTVEEVISLHCSASYEVAFCGFAPGFGYLRGLVGELHLRRRSTPRTRVPAGSVAIASEFSAVYPSESPGGWHLLGTTTLTMFDARRRPPALLAPGTAVRFEPT